MTPEKYKQLSIKEFTQAAKIYDSGHAGIYEMCKDDYPPILAELERSLSTMCSTVAVEPDRCLNCSIKNTRINIISVSTSLLK